MAKSWRESIMKKENAISEERIFNIYTWEAKKKWRMKKLNWRDYSHLSLEARS